MIHFERDTDALERKRAAIAHGSDGTDRGADVWSLRDACCASTVEAFLPDHEVYITDWADARMVPLVIAGRFDLNDYVDHVMGDAARAWATDACRRCVSAWTRGASGCCSVMADAR